MMPKFWPAKEYFEKFVDPQLAEMGDDHRVVAGFLGRQLKEWGRTAERLADWASKDDGSPNPYTPEIDLIMVPAFTIGLAKRLGTLRGRIRAKVAGDPAGARKRRPAEAANSATETI